MKIRKDVILTVLATFCLTVTLFSFVPAFSGLPYDPWSDINEDGKINMYDIGTTAAQFGTTGDPTKNVNVVNWPNLTDSSVWWFASVGPQPSGMLVSQGYLAQGFSTLHVLVSTMNPLGSNTITIEILTPLYNPDHLAMRPITAQSFQLYSGYAEYGFVVPVPGVSFYFVAWTSAGYYDLSLSFYLTWG